MNEKLSVNLTGKDAAKLLEGLTKDPQLRSEDDPSILAEEQFPTDHHAMLQGRTTGSSTDNIITILQWEKHHTPYLSEEQKVMLVEQKNKTAKLFQFTATNSSPWDEVQFNFWKHKVTNMVLSSIRLALNEDAKSDVNKLLFQLVTTIMSRSAPGTRGTSQDFSSATQSCSTLHLWNQLALINCWTIYFWKGILILFRRRTTIAEVMRRIRRMSRSRLSRQQLSLPCEMCTKSRRTHFTCTGPSTGGTGKHLSCFHSGKRR